MGSSFAPKAFLYRGRRQVCPVPPTLTLTAMPLQNLSWAQPEVAFPPMGYLASGSLCCFRVYHHFYLLF